MMFEQLSLSFFPKTPFTDEISGLIPFEALATFAFASGLLALAPGPDNLFVMTQSALYGRRAGILVTLGLCSGLLFHTALVALGVAALIKASPLAFSLLRFGGAAYLLYLAVLSFRHQPAGAGEHSPQLSGGQLYRRGVVMNITNPKVSLFFLAFLPQFSDPARGDMLSQILLLGAVFMLSALLIFSLIAVLAGFASAWLKGSVQRELWLHRVAGVVFVALAVKLATADITA